MKLPVLRKTRLNRTRRGNFVRNIGGEKLCLGTDEVQAYQRREWIDKIYVQNAVMQGGGAAPPWSDGPLEIAVQIGKLGTAVVEVEERYPSFVPSSFGPPDYSYIDRLRKLGIPIEVVGQGSFTGILAETTVKGTNKPATIKLRQALESYKQSRLKDFVGTYQSKRYAERVIDAIIDHFDHELWLHDLNFESAKSFLSHWSNRPNTKKGKPASTEWCKDLKAEFRSAVRSLPNLLPEEFEPLDLTGIRVRTKKLTTDGEKNRIVQKFLEPEEARSAFEKSDDPLLRLAICLGINSCSGAAELGRMKVDDFLFNTTHPFSKTIKFQGKHSFFIGIRRKTFTHHEALLWPWVAKLVKKQKNICSKNGWKYLFTDDDGQPLYHCDEVYKDVGLDPPGTTKPETAFNSKWGKVKSKHSFGKIRKTFSNYLRVNNHGELASLALAHKTDSDDLLHHYSNKPYGRLFQATVKAESDWNLV